jgi:RNA polymerase sigma factor (sigma-70 family)
VRARVSRGSDHRQSNPRPSFVDVNPDADAYVEAAREGDADALESLLGSVRDRVYRLALRMVTQPSDAEDATQEILLKVMTRLSTFRGDAAFTTWVHRIAVNHLLDRKRTPVERMEMTFDFYAADLANGLTDPSPRSAPDANLLAEEVKLSCTQAMLTCLDRDHRVAYILGEIFEVSSAEGAYICDATSATYRKRLSRARTRVRGFLDDNCGLVSPHKAACRCKKRIETAVSLGRLDPDNLEFASHPATATNVTKGAAEMDDLSTAAALMRSHPDYVAPEALSDRIGELIRSGTFEILE